MITGHCLNDLHEDVCPAASSCTCPCHHPDDEPADLRVMARGDAAVEMSFAWWERDSITGPNPFGGLDEVQA